MSRRKKGNKKKYKKQLTIEIKQLFQSSPNTPLNYKQISGQLGIKDAQLRKLVNTILNELLIQEYLKQYDAGKFKLNLNAGEHIGTLEVVSSGRGFVTSDDFEKDILINKDNLLNALNGDQVVVEIFKKKKGKSEGRIVAVKERAKEHFVGVLEMSENFGFVVPDSPRIHVDFFVPKSKLNGAKNGQKVLVKMTDWPDAESSPFAEVEETLGYPGNNDAEMMSILASYGIPLKFDPKTIQEAEKTPVELDRDEIKKRKDLRTVTTFTIDPVDAKDFDDALSFEVLKNGTYRVGIHIADVSHYVQPNSNIDKEARKRGNSVYLVDRVIPMIPEHLSNLVCSLRPEEEKFCFSAMFTLDKNAKVQDQWFGKTVIFSDHRFTYEQAQEIIEGKKDRHQLKEEVLTLDRLAKKLRKKRMDSGALSIESEEIRFELDEKGIPVGITKKISQDAHKLVEEFMLLANKYVARKVGVKKAGEKISPFVYRIHDKPDPEKLELFKTFISKFGHNISYKNDQDISKSMNKLLHSIKGETEYGIVQQMAIRSMSKATYDTKNIGHYGLHFDYYTHFTSPIRRYADLLVHRILFAELKNKSYEMSGSLQEVCDHISRTERGANDAERDSDKYFQVLYVKNEIGQTFDGIITGITDFGIFVEMIDNRCEGMINLRAIEGDYYYFDEKNYRIIGTNSGVELNLGDKIMVTITNVDVMKRQIDLEIAGELI